MQAVTNVQRSRGWGMAARGLSALLLLGAGVDMLSVSAPADASPYHAKLRALNDALPMNFGNWVGEDKDVAKDAVQMLRPNVIRCRDYRNTVTGQLVSFLLVQCGDARDLQYHYPPVCYVNDGWKNAAETPCAFDISGIHMDGMEYLFTMSSFDGGRMKYVYDFMILPDGRFVPDMPSIEKLAADLHRRFYGAAQVQVVIQTDPQMPGISKAAREAVVKEMLEAHRALIDAIGHGVKNPGVKQ